jgi:hypothetical protein
MKFQFTPKHRRLRPGLEEHPFTIGRLWQGEPEKAVEVTHLFDRTYGYRSARELAWHIAERFDVPPKTVELTRV